MSGKSKIGHNLEKRATCKARSLTSPILLGLEKLDIKAYLRFIGFYTDGDNEESRGYISVYLFLDVQSQPKNKNVTIEFQIKFVNHKDPNECVKKGSKLKKTDLIDRV